MSGTIKRGIVSASVLAALAGVLALLVVLLPKLQVAPDGLSLGSVTVGNEYQSTTSSAWLTRVNPITLKPGPGTLGQVAVLGAPTDFVHTFYDATTSNINNRTNNKATTTLVIVGIPAGATVGTYTFDAEFTNGLLLVASGTAAGTTT